MGIARNLEKTRNLISDPQDWICGTWVRLNPLEDDRSHICMCVEGALAIACLPIELSAFLGGVTVRVQDELPERQKEAIAHLVEQGMNAMHELPEYQFLRTVWERAPHAVNDSLGLESHAQMMEMMQQAIDKAWQVFGE